MVGRGMVTPACEQSCVLKAFHVLPNFNSCFYISHSYNLRFSVGGVVLHLPTNCKKSLQHFFVISTPPTQLSWNLDNMVYRGFSWRTRWLSTSFPWLGGERRWQFSPWLRGNELGGCGSTTRMTLSYLLLFLDISGKKFLLTRKRR